MRALVAELARQTWRGAAVDRLHYALPAYAVACAALVPLASHLSLGASARGAWELGLWMQWLLVCGAAGWLGLAGIGLDLERRTAAVILAGPVPPGVWLLGRALGSAAVLAALVAGLEAIWLAVCLWRGLDLEPALIAVAVGLWLEGAVVAALTGLISTLARPLLAAGASAGIWVAGHLSAEYSRLTEAWGAGNLASVVFSVIPDLDLLDVHGPLVTGGSLDPLETAARFVYGACWLVALGALTVVSLRHRDLA